MSVTQVGSLPPDVLGSDGAMAFFYLLEDPWVELVRASCLVRFKACQQFQDSLYGYGKLSHFL